jgi:two-component system response regulator HydG
MPAPSQHRVLVVDDDRLILRLLEEYLSQKGFLPTLAADGMEAAEAFDPDLFEVVLADVMMPRMGGMELLEVIKEREPEMPVIIITASGDEETKKEAYQKGAFLYLTKPLDFNLLALATQQAAEKFSLIREKRQLAEALGRRYRFENLIGSSGKMQEVFSLITKVASSNASVLIQGESGTGKELVARAIHYHSRRRQGPFIAVNCAAIPKELMESELFGHVKGAFTGAIADKKGKFELADGGTIFLDEIGDLDISLQAKILRALQEREFERVGGTVPIRVNIRLIAATNKDLSRAMKEGTFREDLFYRLSVIPLRIPPLRERKEDVPALAEHFLRRFSQENEKRIKGISARAMEALLAYDWPGNVRELENCLERAVVMAEAEWIRLADLPLYLQGEPAGKEDRGRPQAANSICLELGRTMREVEKEYVLRTLKELGGNRTRTAEVLGISVRGLRDKLREWGYPAAFGAREEEGTSRQ